MLKYINVYNIRYICMSFQSETNNFKLSQIIKIFNIILIEEDMISIKIKTSFHLKKLVFVSILSYEL